jgi:RsiW-degrading membrane proteinase PrsW (M82 family)
MVPPQAPAASRPWLQLFAAGAAVWLLSAGITALTRDTILVPTVILLGSFLVPVTVVAWALGRGGAGRLPESALAIGFLIAGTLGVALSAVTEITLLPSAAGTFLGIGIIEEGTKAAVVALVARGLATHRVRDGMVLGAVVGAGFASFESAGYALTAVIGHADDHPVLRILGTEAFRALLAPFGHITWTALMGGAIFAAWARPPGWWRRLGGTFAGVAVLHGLWDASYGVAIMAAQGVEGDGWRLDWPNTQAWIGSPTGSRLVVFQAVYDGLVALVGLVGAAWVVHCWRRAAPPAEGGAGPGPQERPGLVLASDGPDPGALGASS